MRYRHLVHFIYTKCGCMSVVCLSSIGTYWIILILNAWLKELDLPDGETMEGQTIKILAVGPSSQVTSSQWYDINGYLFYTAAKDKKTVSQKQWCSYWGLRLENSAKYNIFQCHIWYMRSAQWFQCTNSGLSVSLGQTPERCWGGRLWTHDCRPQKCWL